MTSPQTHILGHQLPDHLAQAVLQNVHVPLLSEGRLPVIIWAGSMATITFVLFGSPFFDESERYTSIIHFILAVSCVAAGSHGLIGLLVYRKATADRLAETHRAVAWHRFLVATLLATFGLAALWHSWLFSPAAAILGTAAFVMQIMLGIVALPVMLAILSGQSKGQSANMPGCLLVMTAAVTIALIEVTVPGQEWQRHAYFIPIILVERTMSTAFLLTVTQLLSLLTLPWLVPIMATSRLHAQHADQLADR